MKALVIFLACTTFIFATAFALAVASNGEKPTSSKSCANWSQNGRSTYCTRWE